MESLKTLLVGYCDPKVLAISERPIGESGLTRRIAGIARLWEISVALRRRHVWRFGRQHFSDVFTIFVLGVDQAWLTELLRVMDRGRSNTRRGATENLTVELCHERFQSEPSITSDQKNEENKRYAALTSVYDAAGLRDFRDKQMFHLDLSTALTPNRKTGNILEITALLVQWFDHVGSIVYGVEPLFVTRAHRIGKEVARDFRRMLAARLRELVGKPKLNFRKFKSAGWQALFSMFLNSTNKDSIDSD